MMRRCGLTRAASSTPIIIATLGPYTSASIRPTRCPSACIAIARLTATVDLPTPPFPLATAITCRTPGLGRRALCAAAARGWAASTSTCTPGTPGMAATVRLTSSITVRTTSGLADTGARNTVTPAWATSMSLIRPKETMSRLKPGYLIFLSSLRISLGLGIVLVDPPLNVIITATGTKRGDEEPGGWRERRRCGGKAAYHAAPGRAGAGIRRPRAGCGSGPDAVGAGRGAAQRRFARSAPGSELWCGPGAIR